MRVWQQIDVKVEVFVILEIKTGLKSVSHTVSMTI